MKINAKIEKEVDDFILRKIEDYPEFKFDKRKFLDFIHELFKEKNSNEISKEDFRKDIYELLEDRTEEFVDELDKEIEKLNLTINHYKNCGDDSDVDYDSDDDPDDPPANRKKGSKGADRESSNSKPFEKSFSPEKENPHMLSREDKSFGHISKRAPMQHPVPGPFPMILPHMPPGNRMHGPGLTPPGMVPGFPHGMAPGMQARMGPPGMNPPYPPHGMMPPSPYFFPPMMPPGMPPMNPYFPFPEPKSSNAPKTNQAGGNAPNPNPSNNENSNDKQKKPRKDQNEASNSSNERNQSVEPKRNNNNINNNSNNGNFKNNGSKPQENKGPGRRNNNSNGGPGKFGHQHSNSAVYIKNIPDSENKISVLSGYFEHYGTIKKIETDEKNKSAVITFSSRDEAQLAVKNKTGIFDKSFITFSLEPHDMHSSSQEQNRQVHFKPAPKQNHQPQQLSNPNPPKKLAANPKPVSTVPKKEISQSEEKKQAGPSSAMPKPELKPTTSTENIKKPVNPFKTNKLAKTDEIKLKKEREQIKNSLLSKITEKIKFLLFLKNRTQDAKLKDELMKFFNEMNQKKDEVNQRAKQGEDLKEVLDAYSEKSPFDFALVLEDLPEELNSYSSLQKRFEGFGKIENLKIKQQERKAILKFATFDNAEAAYLQVNDINIMFADPNLIKFVQNPNDKAETGTGNQQTQAPNSHEPEPEPKAVADQMDVEVEKPKAEIVDI